MTSSCSQKSKVNCVVNDLQLKRTEEAVEAFKNHVLDMSQEEWKNCYDQWFERMQKCIDHHGEYFEKQ